MPNRLHCILFFAAADFSLNKIISNAKRFMAYEIIKRLKDARQELILQELQSTVTDKEKAKGQIHKVFVESFFLSSIVSR
jgi:putative transposase